MGAELGNQSNTDVLLRSSATPPPIFASDREQRPVSDANLDRKWSPTDGEMPPLT